MKPRCSWTGYLKVSLVTVPVRVYTAISSSEKITFNQLHKSCHQRIRQKLFCPTHGEVTREDLIKGYEYEADKFVILSESDLDGVRLETTGTIELVQFVRAEELDSLFLDTPYYIGPDGPVAEEGFGVLREALRRAKRIGIGRVVLGGKEKVVAVKPHGKGFVFFTLRYVAEVRPAIKFFEDLSDKPVDATQVALAQKLIESKSGALNLANFEDRYQAAVVDLIKAKVAGTELVLAPRREVGKLVSLMEALRQSVAQTEQKPLPAARKNGHKKVAIAA